MEEANADASTRSFSGNNSSWTISSAAKSLKTTQPTISRQLTDLEYSLKLKLLIRRKGQVVPTPDGMVFYRRLDDVFDAFAKLRNTAQDISLDRGKH